MSLLGRFAPGLIVFLTAVLSLRRFDNTDTWWHLAGGRWIVQHHRIPSLDPLSFTASDHAWVNVQWLFDVVIYGLYQLGGPSLLVIVSALAYAAAVALMLVNVRRYADAVTTAVLGGWAVLVAQERFAIRPEMLTYLLLQALIYLYGTARDDRGRRLWLVPVVMALWANCHSLFSVGVVVIVCQIAGTLLSELPFLPGGWRTPVDAQTRNRIVWTGLAGIAATILNPFGIRGALFPVELLSRFNRENPSFRMIGEFQPPFSGYFVTLSITAYQVLVVVASIVVLAALVTAAVRGGTIAAPQKGGGRAQRRRTGAPPPPPRETPVVREPCPPIDLAMVAVFIGVAYLSMQARRNMALFAMAGTPAFAAALSILASQFPEGARRGLGWVGQAVAVALVPVVLGFSWYVASNGFYRSNDEMHEFGLGVFDVRFPIRASQFAKDQRLPGPVFNDLSNGGYMTWDEPIPGGVYVDGRLEVYDAPFLDTYVRQVGNPTEWQQEMDRRNVQTVVFFHWWPNHRNLNNYLLRDPRWAVVYYDETSIVAVRKEGNEEAIARAQAAFPAARAETDRILLDPSKPWQYPVGRARGLLMYGAVLQMMGKGSEAQKYQARLNELSRAS
jgi:hypothetical protein